MDTPLANTPSADVKSCCARLYETDVVRLLLGESFHPGGLRLTTRIGDLLGLTSSSKILDVASGRGDSALHLAFTFGCEVIGIDYGSDSVRLANQAADERGLANRVRFQEGDAERLPFPDGGFDAVLCECAYCTFPDKAAAAAEFYRVVKTNGRVGISDIVRAEPLPQALNTLLAWVACIADAQSVENYVSLLSAGGFHSVTVEPHDKALIEMVRQIQGKLLGMEIAAALKKLQIPDFDFDSAKQLAAGALSAIHQKDLGYAIVVGSR